MKRLLTALTLTLGIALGPTAIAHAEPTHHTTPTSIEAPTPRVLHATNSTTLYICAATRPSGAYEVVHAWEHALYPGVLIVRCIVESTWTSARICYEAAWFIDAGVIARSSDYYTETCPWGAHAP